MPQCLFSLTHLAVCRFGLVALALCRICAGRDHAAVWKLPVDETWQRGLHCCPLEVAWVGGFLRVSQRLTLDLHSVFRNPLLAFCLEGDSLAAGVGAGGGHQTWARASPPHPPSCGSCGRPACVLDRLPNTPLTLHLPCPPSGGGFGHSLATFRFLPLNQSLGYPRAGFGKFLSFFPAESFTICSFAFQLPKLGLPSRLLLFSQQSP